MKLGLGLGKEVAQGIPLALLCIVIFVTIGSLVAQSVSGEPEAEPAPAVQKKEPAVVAGGVKDEPAPALLKKNAPAK